MPAAVATSASEMPVITAAVPPVPPASTSRPRSLKDRMMPATVPNRPTNGVVAPMVARIHRLRRSLSPTWARSRSTAASTPPPLVLARSRRSKPARKMSAATASERSAGRPGRGDVPAQQVLVDRFTQGSRERSLTPHRAMSRSMATPSATTEASKRMARVTPPRRR